MFDTWFELFYLVAILVPPLSASRLSTHNSHG